MSTTVSGATQLLGPIPARGSSVGRTVADVPHAPDLHALRATRSSSTLDEASGRVVTVVVRQRDGSVVAQTPDPQALRVLAGIREMVGVTVDELI
jgi:hypothetical protein